MKKATENVFRASMNSFFKGGKSTANSSLQSFSQAGEDNKENDDGGVSELVSNTD